MITTYKIFEGLNKPKIGDWVVCKITWVDESDIYFNFLSNNVGKLIDYRKGVGYYFVRYYPENEKYKKNYKDFKKDTRTAGDYLTMREWEILFFSDKKEDCEVYIQTKKYNL